MVPKEHPFLREHFQFIEYLNKLSNHECFDVYKKDALFSIPSDALESNAYAHDGSPVYCSLFTDGAYKEGRCGSGFFVDDFLARPSRQSKQYGPVQGKRSNNTAELTVIIKGIAFCKTFTPRRIHIFTDSLYCIFSLTMYKRS